MNKSKSLKKNINRQWLKSLIKKLKKESSKLSKNCKRNMPKLKYQSKKIEDEKQILEVEWL